MNAKTMPLDAVARLIELTTDEAAMRAHADLTVVVAARALRLAADELEDGGQQAAASLLRRRAGEYEQWSA